MSGLMNTSHLLKQAIVPEKSVPMDKSSEGYVRPQALQELVDILQSPCQDTCTRCGSLECLNSINISEHTIIR